MPFSLYCFEFPTDLKRYKYKGNIKQVTSKYYEVLGSSTILAASSVSHFSKDGNYEKIEFFDSENTLTHYIVFKKINNKRELVTYSSENDTVKIIIEEYDITGRKMTEKFVKEDGKTDFTQEYKYDSNGNVTEKSVIDTFGNISSITENKYDKNNNLIGFTNHFKNLFGIGDRTVTSIFKLDDHGNVIESLDDFRAKEPVTKYIFDYKYDEYFNIVEQKEFRITGENEKILVKVTKKEYKFW